MDPETPIPDPFRQEFWWLFHMMIIMGFMVNHWKIIEALQVFVI